MSEDQEDIQAAKDALEDAKKKGEKPIPWEKAREDLDLNRLMMKYFVLKPSGNNIYASASRAAMWTYASAIKTEHPELANDIFDWVKRELKEKGDKS